jgi:hypothetical protein
MFRATLAHFEEFREDQYDFHGYCLRKLTLRAYVDMLHMEDGIYGSQAFRDAAVGAIQCYLALHDRPPGCAEAEAEAAQLATLSDAQRKKFLDKKRKEAAKAAKAEAEHLEKLRAAHSQRKNALKFDEVLLTMLTGCISLPCPSASRLLAELAASVMSHTHEPVLCAFELPCLPASSPPR